MAADALGTIGSEQAVEPLAKLVSSPNKKVRASVIDALDQIVEKGDDALAARCLPLIESLISDSSKSNRQSSAYLGQKIRKRLGLPDHPDMARLESEWENNIFLD
jgi:HEAT repeat protein